MAFNLDALSPGGPNPCMVKIWISPSLFLSSMDLACIGAISQFFVDSRIGCNYKKQRCVATIITREWNLQGGAWVGIYHEWKDKVPRQCPGGSARLV
jgi:hypothetical protein